MQSKVAYVVQTSASRLALGCRRDAMWTLATSGTAQPVLNSSNSCSLTETALQGPHLPQEHPAGRNSRRRVRPDLIMREDLQTVERLTTCWPQRKTHVYCTCRVLAPSFQSFASAGTWMLPHLLIHLCGTQEYRGGQQHESRQQGHGGSWLQRALLLAVTPKPSVSSDRELCTVVCTCKSYGMRIYVMSVYVFVCKCVFVYAYENSMCCMCGG